MRTRFAPSPTGRLHLGHAFSALTAWDLAARLGGVALVRIEDIDLTRCRPEFEAGIFEDLAWLGLAWPEPVLRQSSRDHTPYLDRLAAAGLLYPCRCTRADLRAALAAPQEGSGDALGVYPGTCRGRPMAAAGAGDALRLDLGRALAAFGAGLAVEECGPLHPGRHPLDGAQLQRTLGDVVLRRKDIGTSYHLAVVADDAWQGVTHVVRGADLWGSTPLHRLLQAALGLPAPVWHHHRLIRDDAGRRLAKRDAARSLASLRAAGITAAELRAGLGFPPGFPAGEIPGGGPAEIC